MLSQAMMHDKVNIEPTVAMEPKKQSNTKKYAIAAASVVTVIALVITGTLLAVHFTQKSTLDLMKAYQVAFKDGNTEFKQQVEISTTEKLEALHSLPSDGKDETFVLHDYNTKKTALRFSGDKSCFIRDMPEEMAAKDLKNEEERMDKSEAQGGKISAVKEGYYQAVHDPVDQSTLSDAILDFCSGLKIQLLVLTTKDKIAETSRDDSKTRHRRDLFAQFSNFADRKLKGLQAALGSKASGKNNAAAGGVGVASVGGGLGRVPIPNAYGPGPVGPGPVGPGPVGPGPVGPGPVGPGPVGPGPVGPGPVGPGPVGPGPVGPGPVGPGPVGPGPVGPGPVGPGPVGPGPLGPGPVGPGPVGPGPKKPLNVGCLNQSACKVKEGCTVKTDRVCVDYGWFFGNRGGLGRKGYVSSPACRKYQYNEVKDCVIVNNCEELCT